MRPIRRRPARPGSIGTVGDDQVQPIKQGNGKRDESRIGWEHKENGEGYRYSKPRSEGAQTRRRQTRLSSPLGGFLLLSFNCVELIGFDSRC